MHKFEVEKIRRALKEWDDLTAEHTYLVSLRDKVKDVPPKHLEVHINGSLEGESLVVNLRDAITRELHEWLVQRLSADIAQTVRAQERITCPAGVDLHLKKGAQT